MTTTLGVALGVAVVVAIQLTNASSLRGFETALNAVSGRASLEIVGTGVGVDETRLTGGVRVVPRETAMDDRKQDRRHGITDRRKHPRTDRRKLRS